MKLKTNLKLISRKTIALVIIVSFLLSSFSSIIIAVGAEEKTFQNITVDTAYHMIKKENKYQNLVILDVRTPSEYDKSHLYDAILIPYDDLEERIKELEEYIHFDIIIYCKSGGRSQQASEILVKNSFTKVYNMFGGIMAWVDAEYPIWSVYHRISVEKVMEDDIAIQIDPIIPNLPDPENHECPCQNQGSSCANTREITSNIIEEGENYKKILTAYELNGVYYEFTSILIYLWSDIEIANEYTRSVSFISIETMNEDTNIKTFYLIYNIQHKKYNLSISTKLVPINAELYSNSETVIFFIGAEKSEITFELIELNNLPATLSELYNISSKIAMKLSNYYKKSYKISNDENMDRLAQNYFIISNEVKLLSKYVKEQLSEYNILIMESKVIIIDPICSEYYTWCIVGCGLFYGFGWECSLFSWFVCLLLGGGWVSIVCGLIFVVICNLPLPPMTYEECCDDCHNIYCI